MFSRARQKPRSRNYRTGRASFFEYDHAGRCVASTERAFTVSNGVIHYGAALSSYRYEYDVCNNLTKLTCSVAGASWDTVYTYDKDNRPKTTTTWSGTVLTNTYDSLGRLTKRTWGLGSSYETRLEYWLNGDNRTTLLHRYYNGNDDPYIYGYDDNGNITSITQGSTSISYTYDAANRLIRENNGVTNQTVQYEYDTWGNILNKKIYAYTTATNPGTPTSTITYTYGNNAWKDQLTSYNGQTITYDAMGNPLTYRGYTFTWQGKQLMSSVKDTQTISFEYNEDGLRQKKTVNNVDTDYFYNGSVLIGMQRGTSKFLFSYDAAGNVVSVKYNGNEYYYVRNGQGDIVKLIDSTGTTVVEYIYNTWGKKVTTTGSMAETLGRWQPFRYRGYVYDWETGFYYLQSRYYDPTTGRFISADVLLSTGQGVMGHNCYAYCLGNPVTLMDEGGCVPSYAVDEADSGSKKKYRIVYFNVPLFSQGDSPLCWAYCQIMMECYKHGNNLTQEEADSIAISLAKIAFGPNYRDRWDKGFFPLNRRVLPINRCYYETIDGLAQVLENCGPVYARYKDEKGAHYVIVTGVNVTLNIVYTNNPWGVAGVQSFEDFLKGYASDKNAQQDIPLFNLIRAR